MRGFVRQWCGSTWKAGRGHARRVSGTVPFARSETDLSNINVVFAVGFDNFVGHEDARVSCAPSFPNVRPGGGAGNTPCKEPYGMPTNAEFRRLVSFLRIDRGPSPTVESLCWHLRQFYLDMPDLALTVDDVRQAFESTKSRSRAALGALADASFLRSDGEDRWVRGLPPGVASWSRQGPHPTVLAPHVRAHRQRLVETATRAVLAPVMLAGSRPTVKVPLRGGALAASFRLPRLRSVSSRGRSDSRTGTCPSHLDAVTYRVTARL